jgi:hypothetical protein
MEDLRREPLRVHATDLLDTLGDGWSLMKKFTTSASWNSGPSSRPNSHTARFSGAKTDTSTSSSTRFLSSRIQASKSSSGMEPHRSPGEDPVRFAVVGLAQRQGRDRGGRRARRAGRRGGLGRRHSSRARAGGKGTAVDLVPLSAQIGPYPPVSASTPKQRLSAWCCGTEPKAVERFARV